VRPHVAVLIARLALLLALLPPVGCGSDDTPSTPSGLPGVAPGTGSGPVRIELVAADPLPGQTVSGCGPTAAGCIGRIRMTFRLTPAAGSPVGQFAVAWLHAQNRIACLQSRVSGPLPLQPAPAPTTLVLVFDQSDPSGSCGTPLDVQALAFVIEGPIEVASRQEWQLAYRLMP
jgi:hypothetical protein